MIKFKIKVFTENGSNGFLVGSRLSLADLALLEVILLIEEYYGLVELEAYPQLKKFLITMNSNDAIAAYLNGTQRPKKNEEEQNFNKKKMTALVMSCFTVGFVGLSLCFCFFV